jgi:hypothetical protein
MISTARQERRAEQLRAADRHGFCVHGGGQPARVGLVAEHVDVGRLIPAPEQRGGGAADDPPAAGQPARRPRDGLEGGGELRRHWRAQ